MKDFRKDPVGWVSAALSEIAPAEKVGVWLDTMGTTLGAEEIAKLGRTIQRRDEMPEVYQLPPDYPAQNAMFYFPANRKFPQKTHSTFARNMKEKDLWDEGNRLWSYPGLGGALMSTVGIDLTTGECLHPGPCAPVAMWVALEGTVPYDEIAKELKTRYSTRPGEVEDYVARLNAAAPSPVFETREPLSGMNYKMNTWRDIKNRGRSGVMQVMLDATPREPETGHAIGFYRGNQVLQGHAVPYHPKQFKFIDYRMYFRP